MDIGDKVRAIYDKEANQDNKNSIFTVRSIHDLDEIKNLHRKISPTLKHFRLKKAKTALKMGKFRMGSNLLEVGSNIGQFTTLFAEKGYKMTGIDFSKTSIKIANKNAELLKFKNIKYFEANAEDLHIFKENTFDGVVSFSTLRYVPNLKKALSEIYKVTRPGGIVVLDFPNKYCPWFSLLKNRFGVMDHINDHFFSARELRFLFNEVGFRDIEIKKIMFTHYTFKPSLLWLYKLIDFIGEHTLLIKEMAAIILCKGIKI